MSGTGRLLLRDRSFIRCGMRCFPLRDFALEVIEIPDIRWQRGFFDSERAGLLISGDSIQKEGPIYMFGSYRNLDRYIESLRRLPGYVGPHPPDPAQPSFAPYRP